MFQLIKLILICFVFITLLTLWVFYLAIRPIRIVSSITPAQLGLSYEAVSFKTTDNVTIKGWFISNKDPHAKTIILLHGYPADKGDILSSRIFLHKHYHLLFIDFRYLGESGGHFSTVGKREVLDLRAAIDYLRKRHINEVGVWGFSLGGATALLAAPESPEIKAIVAESAYARLDLLADNYYPIPGLNWVIGKFLRLWSWLFLNIDLQSLQPVQSISKLNIPILLFYSSDDQLINYQHALLMQEAGKNKPNVKLIMINGHHGMLIENYQSIVSEFFEKAFKKRK